MRYLSFRNSAAKQNPKGLVEQLSIQKFELGDPFLGFGEKRAAIIRPVKVYLSNDRVVDWERKSLEDEIEKIKEAGTLRYAIIVFILGLLAQALALALEYYWDSNVKVKVK